MKIEKQSMQYALSSESIDTVSDNVQAFLEKLRTERKNIIRLKLTIESILLRMQEHFGEKAEFTFSAGTRFGKPQITLELAGEQFDPTESDDDFGDMNATLLTGLGMFPTYAYTKNVNTVTFKLKKKQSNPIAVLLIAILSGCLVGGLGLLIPGSFRTDAYEYVLTPLYNTYVGILGTLSGPMVFLSVAWGIYGIGDAATLGKIGKKLLIRYLSATALVTCFCMAVFLPFLQMRFASGDVDSSGFGKILELLLGMFPKNLVSPFLEGNTMQIILIAAVVGVAMLILGSQIKVIASFIEQINYIIRYVIEIVGGAMPVFIFLIILRIVWGDSLSDIAVVWQPLLICTVLTIVITLFVIAIVCIKEKVGFGVLTKKMLPSFLIALTTSSSAAAFGTTMSTLENDLGVSTKISKFGLPLGIVLFKPGGAISFVVFGLFFAKVYDVGISAAWIITAAIVMAILSISLPPIPGGALACYTIMIAQLGIPSEALGALMILSILSDFVATGCETVLRQCQLILCGDQIKLLNKDVLRTPKKRLS